MILRFEFAKGARVKYLSHLDLLRTMERAYRRAAVPVALSSGYHPHPRVSYGPPLPVGVTSTAEYADIVLDRPLSPEAFVSAMNHKLPPGFFVRRAIAVSEEAKLRSLMSIISVGSYVVVLDPCGGTLETGTPGGVDWASEVRRLLESPTLPATKKSAPRTGRGTGQTEEFRTIDLRPMILDMKLLSGSVTPTIQMWLRTGSSGNCRPDDVLVFLPTRGYERICRTGLFADKGSDLLDPFEVLE